MLDTMSRYLQGIAVKSDAYALLRAFGPGVDRLSSQPLTSAGLVITGAGATTAKTGAAVFYATASGKLVTIAASTNMPALTNNTIPANNFNVFCFFVDAAGVTSLAAGTPAAASGGVIWPQFPVGKALVGFLLVTHSATFTGGTTPLDTATTVYVSPLGPFDPTALI